MEIQNIKVLQLKNEYTESFQGQNKFENIVEGNIASDELVEFKDDLYLPIIAIQSYYFDLFKREDDTDKIMLHDLFLGKDDFQYAFSLWEIEMQTKNPTEEEIKKHIIESWPDVNADDPEEIEDIMNGQAYAFDDDICLRVVPAARVKEIFENITEEKIMNAAKSLEDKLNSQGVTISSDSDYAEKVQVFKDILKIFEKAASENTGVVYALTIW